METINILCATDNTFAPYCGIMLTSLFESNRDCHFDVYVLVDDSLSEKNIRKFGRLGEKYGNEIRLVQIDDSMTRTFPIIGSPRITTPTYYRLLAADLLPKNIRRVIYLDCDILVIGDIRPMWNVNLAGSALAGVKECRSDYHCERLGYNASFGYVNAGVLVMNLDYWRENRTFESLCDYSKNNASKLKFNDQDILNGTLHDHLLLMDSRYNFLIYTLYTGVWNDFSDERREYYFGEYLKTAIVHFAGRRKPWDYRSYLGPFFHEWEHFRRKSLWRNSKNIKPFTKHVKYLIKKYLFPGI